MNQRCFERYSGSGEIPTGGIKNHCCRRVLASWLSSLDTYPRILDGPLGHQGEPLKVYFFWLDSYLAFLALIIKIAKTHKINQDNLHNFFTNIILRLVSSASPSTLYI